ncbi:CAP domain-containing protein [Marinactinospora thermotolerans]|uniref:Uncharacterized conserved protein YkwD, contains CAP (CSP/antigen 5/PR1) domain n=1 Tax=Marinactinospora thermotolerans DSM 45154 TaxID=1122192 RepID=A0A1T4LP54_9ACTN|nr:CAP domain-containing protein [Marinactinospora thermotolerans]SJZ56475.1 Uncharacterized conserved protein YkwD, contains CAP (CSP/antigen 5/PR1) domain [Marinactinospora thermotolerans DSM 45154]
MIGALAAVPVGLGLAAALTLASLSSDEAGEQAGDLNVIVPDDSLPPVPSSAAPASSPAPSASPSAPDVPSATGETTELSVEIPAEEVSPRPSPSGGDRGEAEREEEPDEAPQADSAAAVVALANAERAAAGCAPLRPDERLTSAAQSHSEDMAQREYMAHENPEGEGPDERAAAAGYGAWSGENVAAGQSSAEEVMSAWMNSPGHRANILDCDNRSIGVGRDGVHWTQMFGRE